MVDSAFPLWDNRAMELFDLRCFIRIAALGSISVAARTLKEPKSSVSRSLVRLEAALGSVLIERSTRSLRLTEAGRLLQQHASRILHEVDEAEAALGDLAGVPHGTIRVNAPFAFALAAVAPMLPGFLQRYPEVRVVLEPEDGQMDMLSGEADLLIRLGPLPDTALITRRLTTVELWTCASPDYLSGHGTPSCAGDLAAHEIIGRTDRGLTWSFRHSDGRTEDISLHPRAAVPDMVMTRTVLAGGAGIGQLPDFMAADAISAGELRRILPHLQPATGEAHVLYPSHRGLPAKVRVFIDSLVIRIAAQRAAFNAANGS